MSSISRTWRFMLLAMGALLLLVQPTAAAPVTLVNGGPEVFFLYQPTGFPNSLGISGFQLSGNVLTVRLGNFGTEVGGDGGSLIDAIGFNSTPGVTVSNLAQSGDVSGWIVNQGPLGVFEVSSADGPGGGQSDLLHQGQRTTLVFTLANFSGNLTIDLTQIHIQSLGTGDGGSQKPDGTLIPPGPDPFGVNPVPEPGSMILLGTGLLGLGGAVRRRYKLGKQRNKNW